MQFHKSDGQFPIIFKSVKYTAPLHPKILPTLFNKTDLYWIRHSIEMQNTDENNHLAIMLLHASADTFSILPYKSAMNWQRRHFRMVSGNGKPSCMSNGKGRWSNGCSTWLVRVWSQILNTLQTILCYSVLLDLLQWYWWQCNKNI